MKNEHTVTFTLKANAQGFIGRTCPSCRSYFTVGSSPEFEGRQNLMTEISCPYCGHREKGLSFNTAEQQAYMESFHAHNAESFMLAELSKVMGKGYRSKHVQLKVNIPQRPEFTAPQPVDPALEHTNTCASCSAQYQVSKSAEFCPFCASENQVAV
jgi:rRNA maturation endonuclease Nob1